MKRIKYLRASLATTMAAMMILSSSCTTSSGNEVLVGAVTKYRAEPAQELAKDSPAPNFQFTMPDGSLVYLNDFKGKVVLLNFWRVDCIYCEAEMVYLEKASQDWKDKVVVLGVNTGDPAKRVKSFITDTGITFPVILDPDAYPTKIYSVYYLPVTFVIDQAGELVEAKIGAFKSTAEVNDEINKALAEVTG